MKLILFILFLLVLPFCSSTPEPKIPQGKGIILITYDGYNSRGDYWGFQNWESSGIDSRVARDYIDSTVKNFYNLWDVKVTEDQTEFYKYPVYQRVRCVITQTQLEDSAHGYSYTSMIKGDTSCALVDSKSLNYNLYDIATCVTHEIGHQLGLDHIIIGFKFIDGAPFVVLDTGSAKTQSVPIMGWPLTYHNRYWGRGLRDNGWWQDDTMIISYSWNRVK